MLLEANLNFFIVTLLTIFNNYRMQTYFGLVLYVLVTILICSLLAAVTYLLSLSSSQDSEKKSEYECGFEPFDSATRLPFDVHFYLVGILFLIFDVEIALLFPWVLSLNTCGWFGFYLMVFFILLLSIGFLYEWKRGALIWPSRQRETAYAFGAPAWTIEYEERGNDDLSDKEIAELMHEWETNPYYQLQYLYEEKQRLGKLPKEELMIEWEDSNDFKQGAIDEELNEMMEESGFNVKLSSITQNVLDHIHTGQKHELVYLIVPMLAEITLSFMILYVIVTVALVLDKKHLKKALALETLNAFLVGLVFIFILLEIEIIKGFSTTLFNGYASSNGYTIVLKMLLCFTVFFVMNASKTYITNHEKDLMEYPTIVALALFFMLLLISSQHLISAFLCIIGFSLNLYVLILFDAPEAVAREAGIKYYYLSTFSSGLILYGIFLMLLITKTGNFKEINQILNTAPELLTNDILKASIGLILTGLFFKLSAFPGHLWAAEVYEGSPDVITAFFMLPVKIATIAFLLQLLSVALEPARAIWQPIVSLSAVSSMLWGCFAAVFEKKTKRFLAYASINQIGFIFIGICTASIEGYRATLIYLLIYTLMNIGFLTIFLNLFLPSGTSLTYLTDFRGLGLENWLINWALAIFMLSMAGIPPLAGFFGKFYLILHALEQQLYVVVTVALVTSLISAFYYLRIIKIIWFESYTNARKISCLFSNDQYLLMFLIEVILFTFIILAPTILVSTDLMVVRLTIAII